MQQVNKMIIVAKIEQIMNSDNMINLIVLLDNLEKMNLKLELDNQEGLFQGCIYEFEIAKYANSEKNVGYVIGHKSVNDIEDIEKKNNIFRSFMQAAPINYLELKGKIECFVSKIENNVLKEITMKILNKYQNDFYLYPAAQKLHHAYIGGLAYHTLGMLELVDAFINNYPFIDKDLMYAGILLHDMGKVIEFSGIENVTYAVKGQLLGHLLIGCNEINQTAIEMGYENEEVVLELSHIVASHHGQQIFGAIKKPATAEAMLLWYIDTIDSKFRVLGEELSKIKPGQFTDPIGVMDRTKFYKRK